jgi:hypothetical protein
MVMRSAGSTVLAGLLAALASGCSSDFTPASYLNDLRVLAIVAEPLEVGPGQDLNLRPYVYLPGGAQLSSEGWTFCPLSAGSAAGYACAVPQCQFDLPAAPDRSLTANPTDLVLRCAATLGGGGLPSGLPEVVQTFFRYQIRICGSQEPQCVREAVQVVPLWTRGPPLDPNLPPVIRGVEIGGVAASAGATVASLPANGKTSVRVIIDPQSVQTYRDAAGREVQETMTVSYYSTAGRFAQDRATGVDVSVDLEAKDLLPEQKEAQVYVVARDLRGGQAVAGPFTVPISP